MPPTVDELLAEFEAWAKSATATFSDDGEYNVEWTDLAFYDDLRDMVRRLLVRAQGGDPS